MRMTLSFSASRGRRRATVNALVVPSWVVTTALLIGCAQPPEAHNHVAEPGLPQNLENNAPSWVEEFSDDVPLAEGSRPHVLLISLDTLRADHLGAWGYHRPTSPFLDELARFGVRFDQTFSHSPKTAPSHMSVFTGAYPYDHGAHVQHTSKTGPPVAYPAPRDLKTLPEVMLNAGYQTAAWTGGGQVSRKTGFARGFGHFGEGMRYISTVQMQEIRTWFGRHSKNPCFLFVHTYQIHDPYLPPPPYNKFFTDQNYNGWIIGNKDQILGQAGKLSERDLHKAFWRQTDWRPDPLLVGPKDRQHLLDLYDGGIRYTDDVLQGFFEDLRDDGLLENTLVVIFSDHGEEFLEHGGLLHEKLYRETLHVPLIFFWPARLPRGLEVEAQVPLMDLTPTLLELAGLDSLPQSDARSLVPMFDEGDRREPRPVYSEAPWVHWKAYHRSFRNETHMVYDQDHGNIELYHTEIDPLEREEVSADVPETAVTLYREMVAFLERRVLVSEGISESANELTAAEIEALRALGYVE